LDRLREDFARGGHVAILRPSDESKVTGIGMRYHRALAYSWIGEPANALQELERGVEERTFGILEALADPEFAPLHRDPRFRALRTRVNLPAGDTQVSRR